MENKNNMGNQPLESARSGAVSIAIFDGQYGKSVVVQKSYLPKKVKDALGEGEKAKPEDWVRSQINLFLNEVPALKEVVDEIMVKAKDDIEASMKKPDEEEKKE